MRKCIQLFKKKVEPQGDGVNVFSARGSNSVLGGGLLHQYDATICRDPCTYSQSPKRYGRKYLPDVLLGLDYWALILF